MNARLASPWIEKAHGDIGIAERLITFAEFHASFSCFHSQQAAEKALKALLAAHEIALEIDPHLASS